MPERTESILLVDDSPANLRLLSEMLGGQGYKVRAATSGERALASAELDPPDLVLLDIRMPAMDGFEVCRRLKANPKTAAAPVLFISALDDVDDKLSAFTAGGVDYITKPFHMEEVLARLETHLALRRLQRSLEETNRQMNRELELAARVQASFMGRSLPEMDGYDLSVKLVPARQTSGDFYDVVALPDGRTGLLMADVVDKGVGAALYMAMCCALLRASLLDHSGVPHVVCATVNEKLLTYATSDQFVTVFLGVLEPASGAFSYANAGHNPPLWLRRDGPSQWLTNTGPPLSLLESVEWGRRAIQLAPGDTLVIYTDGATEAEGAPNEFYGRERLQVVSECAFGQSATAVRDAILSDVESFTRQTHFSDDLALMVLTRCRE